MAVYATHSQAIQDLLLGFWQEDSGATFIEYTLIVALMSLAMLSFFGTTADSMSEAFTGVASEIDASRP